MILDWSNPLKHWSWEAKACRYCGWMTHLRDGKAAPAHKVCAELALARQAAEAAEDRAAGLI